VAFKVVGTGSVGLRDYCVYMEGNGPQDPLVFADQGRGGVGVCSVLTDPHVAKQQGQRVVEGQRFYPDGDGHSAGVHEDCGRDYLVRQLSDHKASIELTDLKGDGLLEYAQLCGELLAGACAVGGCAGDRVRGGGEWIWQGAGQRLARLMRTRRRRIGWS